MKKKQIIWAVIGLLVVLVLVMGYCFKQKPTPAPAQNPMVQTQNTNPLDVEYSKLTPAEKEQYDKIKKAIEDNVPNFISFMNQPNPNGIIKYDFNKDGKIDTLNYSTSKISGATNFIAIGCCTVNINGKIIEINSEAPEGISGIGVIDIDLRDNFVEFYVNDDYLRGGNPRIYRLTVNNEIEKVCIINGGILASSGDGKIYYWGGNLIEGHFNPDLVLSYYDVYKKDYVNANQIIGKTITADMKISVYKNSEDIFKDAYNPTSKETEVQKLSTGKLVSIIQEGDKFQVLESKMGSDSAKIKTSDGKTGWIGGFHVVWD